MCTSNAWCLHKRIFQWQPPNYRVSICLFILAEIFGNKSNFLHMPTWINNFSTVVLDVPEKKGAPADELDNNHEKRKHEVR